MSLTDDACVDQLWKQIFALQKTIERHERVIDQQGEVLEKLSGFVSENRPTLREIIETVAEFYCVTVTDILGKRHIHNAAHPRLVVYYLARKLTRLSLTGVAQRIGQRDHTTIRSGFLAISARIRKDEMLRDDIDILRVRVAERVLAREAALIDQKLTTMARH